MFSALIVILLFMIFVTLIAILVQLRSNQPRANYTTVTDFQRQWLNTPTSAQDPSRRAR